VLQSSKCLRAQLKPSNFGELRHGEVRRIPLPRTRVNKGMKKGRDYSESAPSFWGALRLHASKRILALENPPERREPPLGLRAAPARGGSSIARAASPGGPDGVLGQQPHGVGLRQGPGQPLQSPQVLLQLRTVPLLEAPLQPCQQVRRPLGRAYLLHQLLPPLVHCARLPIGYGHRRPRCSGERRA
jgi:hypothetical protein